MKVFISHITEEAALAAVLKDWIESTFLGGCDVFVSSSTSDLPAGSRWLEEIEAALHGAQVLLVLCSPASIHRPWINFEAGCGWIKRVPILPLCHSGQAKGALPPPLSLFQALEIEEARFTSNLFDALAKHLSVAKVPRLAHGEMASDLATALASVSSGSANIRSAPTANLAARSIHEHHLKALLLLAQHDEEGLSAARVANRLGVSVPKATHYLEVLEKQELAFGVHTFGSSSYFASSEGRALLAEQDLI